MRGRLRTVAHRVDQRYRRSPTLLAAIQPITDDSAAGTCVRRPSRRRWIRWHRVSPQARRAPAARARTRSRAAGGRPMCVASPPAAGATPSSGRRRGRRPPPTVGQEVARAQAARRRAASQRRPNRRSGCPQPRQAWRSRTGRPPRPRRLRRAAATRARNTPHGPTCCGARSRLTFWRAPTAAGGCACWRRSRTVRWSRRSRTSSRCSSSAACSNGIRRCASCASRPTPAGCRTGSIAWITTTSATAICAPPSSPSGRANTCARTSTSRSRTIG